MKATPIPQFGEWSSDNGGSFTGLFEKNKEEKLSVSGFVGPKKTTNSSPTRPNGCWDVTQKPTNGLMGLENFSGGLRQSISSSPPHGGPMSPIIPKFGEWPQSSSSYTAEFEANIREAKSRSELTTVLGNPEMRKLFSHEDLDWLRNMDGSGQEKTGRSKEGKVVPVSAETVRRIGLVEIGTKISSSNASQKSSSTSGSRSPVVVPAFGSWNSTSSSSYTATFEAKQREAYAEARRDVQTETRKDTSRRTEDTNNFHRDDLRESKNGKTEGGREGEGEGEGEVEGGFRIGSEQREGHGDENRDSVKVGVSKEEKDKEGLHSGEARPRTSPEMLDSRGSSGEEEGNSNNKEGQEVSVPHFNDWEGPSNSTSFTAKFQQKGEARVAGGLYEGDGKASLNEERREGLSQNGEREHVNVGGLPVKTEREGSGEKPGSHNRPPGRSKISLEEALRSAEKEGKVAPAQKPVSHVAPMGNWSESQGTAYTSMFEKVRNDRRERGGGGKAIATGTATTEKSRESTALKGRGNEQQPACCVIL